MEVRHQKMLSDAGSNETESGLSAWMSAVSSVPATAEAPGRYLYLPEDRWYPSRLGWGGPSFGRAPFQLPSPGLLLAFGRLGRAVTRLSY